MPNVSQVPTIFSFQRIDWRGSLDEVVNKPSGTGPAAGLSLGSWGETWSQKPVSQLQWT